MIAASSVSAQPSSNPQNQSISGMPVPIPAPMQMPGMPGQTLTPGQMLPLPQSNPGNVGNGKNGKNQRPVTKPVKPIKIINRNANVDISKVLPQLVYMAQGLYKNMSGFENFNEDMLMFHIKKTDNDFWNKYKNIDFVAYTQSEDVAVLGMKTPNCKVEQGRVEARLEALKKSNDRAKVQYEGVTCAGSYVRVSFKQSK